MPQNAIQIRPLLNYYFNNAQTFQYDPPTLLLGGNVIPITMPYNNSSKSVMTFTYKGKTSYYTLNSLYISLSNNNDAMYQLILEGNKNDYANNTTNKILFIIPIFSSVAQTIEGTINSSTRMNNVYITNILHNIKIGEQYNFKSSPSNSDYDTIDINKFLIGVNQGALYNNIIDLNTKIMYNIVQFNMSNIYYNPSRTIVELQNLRKSISIGTIESVPIDILNNNGPISTTIESDIYIDCSPTDTLGEAVDVYTSKNLDQLNLFKINDINYLIQYFGSFVFIIGIILLLAAIIYFTIHIFSLATELKKNTGTGSPDST